MVRYKAVFQKKATLCVRKLQQDTIVPNLKKQGIRAMPEFAWQAFINNDTALQLKWQGMDTLFLYIAIKRLKRQLNDSKLSRPN